MNSLFGWIGGKKLLRKSICERFPEKVGKYVEVFGGAAWVLLYKEKHAAVEVYNDINSNLVNLFRCVKHHPDAIIQEMEYLLNSREIFDCFKKQDTDSLTDIQKAVRYLYLIRASYGSKVSTYGASPRNICKVDGFKELQKRLETVIIENKSFDALISQYDGEETLFYCDPPYFKAEKFYDTGSFVFNEKQHELLKDILSGIKGKFILSYNDCLFIRELYKGFNIEEISRQSNLANAYGADKVYKELIIRNYQGLSFFEKK